MVALIVSASLALPRLPQTLRFWERPLAPADSSGRSTSAATGPTATTAVQAAAPDSAAHTAPDSVPAAPARKAPPPPLPQVVVVIGPMLRVPTRAVAPEPVPPPDTAAASLAEEQLKQPPRTAFGTPTVSLPELANRPQVTRRLRQMYPPELRRAGVAGTAVVRLRIDEAGQVIRRYVVATSGNALLDRVALSSAPLMHFVPARLEGRSVRSEVDIPITFGTTPADTSVSAP